MLGGTPAVISRNDRLVNRARRVVLVGGLLLRLACGLLQMPQTLGGSLAHVGLLRWCRPPGTEGVCTGGRLRRGHPAASVGWCGAESAPSSRILQGCVKGHSLPLTDRTQPTGLRPYPKIRPVTGLSSEVTNALVRLMSGETDYGELTEEELVTILAICADVRTAQYKASTELSNRGRTFAQMAELIKAKNKSVHEATLARWAKRPDPDRRRHRPGSEE